MSQADFDVYDWMDDYDDRKEDSMDTNSNATTTRHEYFQNRLKELGLYDKDSDYEGMIGASVETLSALFASQGHSGMSAEITLSVFKKLMDEWGKAPSV